jgi:pimeloyl-[acyl-carrier protein] methyl ester esterase
VPSLWLAGRRDRMVSPAAMHAAAALAPQARFDEIRRRPCAFPCPPDGVADQLRGFSMSLPA